MTTEVIIKHNTLGYDKHVKVVPIDAAGNPHGQRDGVEHAYTKIIKPGESLTAYVHSGCTLVISEFTPESVLTPTE